MVQGVGGSRDSSVGPLPIRGGGGLLALVMMCWPYVRLPVL